MKKLFLNIFGFAAIAALMVYNTQFIGTNSIGEVSLSSITQIAHAGEGASGGGEGSGGGGKCKAELDCGGGRKVSCEGTNRCFAGTWYVECDGARGEC